MKEKLLSKKYYFFCLLLAFVVLMITSKNSFLYKFNDWVDANAFFTVGKSMFNGVIPYKDVFEQKGIFLYFIYGIGYLFSHNTFHGVFILEIVSFSIFLYYVHKIFKLYFNEKYSLILLPILAYLITTSCSFVHGGSCEEFALPFFAVTFYYYFKHFKDGKLTNKEILLNGVIASLIFLMKYTMIGMFAGFFIIIFIDYLIKKEKKEAFNFIIWYLIGALMPIIITLIYTLFTGSLEEFIECYFIVNLTAYPNNKSNIVINVYRMLRGVYNYLRKDGIVRLILFILAPISVIRINIKADNKSLRSDIYFKLGLLVMFALSGVAIYWGLRFYPYYFLPLYIFLILLLLGVFLFLKRFIDKIIDKKYMYIVFIIINILCISLCYMNANYKKELSYSRNHYFQYKYAKYMNNTSNPTLLNMGFLDAGLYTTSGVVPNTRFFEEQNLDYNRFPDNIDNMRKYIKDKDTKFILFYTKNDLKWLKVNYKEIFKNYKLVYDDKYVFEKEKFNAYLFETK